MFEKAIEKVAQFTRPIHSISRNYVDVVMPGASTLFFINDHGVAITCKHVAEMIMSSDQIQHQFNSFKAEKERIPVNEQLDDQIRELERKYQYQASTTIQLKNNFLNCFDKIEKIDIHTHPSLDLAILQFKGFNQILYKGHATLLKDQTKISQGKFLCRLGFPFPEFNNFQLNAITDDIEWTNIGNSNSPIFPIEGMVTRFLGDQYQGIMGIEMSTPGLRGQSGGPLFDQNGIIYGMQYATGHLHLGFDQSNREIIINGNPTTISNYPFLHVGMCIHINKIKEFLHQHHITFSESD